jgi:sugar O-acyltransferase (sialic acid O-acetyltransferase NeuD family)
MAAQDIVIVGAGGFGREVHQWICDVNSSAFGAAFRVVGFLDSGKAGQTVHGLPVLGDVDWVTSRPEVAAAVSIGSTSARRRIIERLRAANVRLPSIVHPRALVGQNVTIGDGTIICPQVVVTCDIDIGSGVILNIDLTVGHDAVIGDLCTLAPGIHISGYVKIGEGCDLGTGACAVPGVTIGAWSVVGSGAVVSRDLPPNVTAVGVPAKVIKTREDGWHLRA